jgi:serine phosphatase RsbU (regulator of sigma subunit)
VNFTKPILGLTFFVLIFSVISEKNFAQDFGVPLTQKYSAKIYKGATQNWAFVQNSDGVLLVGNGEGILQFDGENWNLLKIPNLSTVRCFSKGNDKTVYVGAQGEIGYLSNNKDGSLKYNSLLKKIPKQFKNFQDVWQICKFPDCLIFQTAKAIFILKDSKPDSFIVIPTKQIFHRSFMVSNQFYVRENGVGLKILTDGSLKLIPGGEKFSSTTVAAIISLTADQNLIVSRDGLFTYNINEFDAKKSLEAIKAPEITKILNEKKVFTAVELQNDQFAFGTLSDGIYITDSHFKILYHLNIENGLTDNQILNLYTDNYQNLWVASGNDITYVLLNSPFTNYSPEFGYSGVPYNSVIHDNHFYTSGADGIFYLSKQQKFKKISHIDSQSWGFWEYENNLYCMTQSGFCKMADTVMESNYYEENVWDIKKIPNTKLFVLGTYYKGFLLAKPEKSGFTISKIKGYKPSVRFFDFDDNSNLWFTSENGIYKANLNKNADSLENIELFDTLKGLPENAQCYVNKITEKSGKHRIVTATPHGIYAFNSTTNHFEKDRSFEIFLKNNTTDIFTEDSDKNIWFQSQNKNGEFQRGFIYLNSAGKYQLKEDIFRKFKEVYAENISFTGKYAIFNTAEGIYLYNKQNFKYSLKSFNVLIRKIAIRDSVVFFGNELKNFQFEKFKHSANDLVFTVSAPFFENSDKTEYSFLLDGSDQNWSEWTKQNIKEYTNLFEGNYTFRVRARNIFGMESAENSYSFTIAPPFYRTVWAYLIYVLLAIIAVLGIVRLNTRRLKAEKEHLEQIVRERTAEIILQKEEIQSQAENLLMSNKKLTEQNEEINQQKEEITSIADSLQSAYETISVINEDIKRKNKNITDSINYAKSIQRAMLPSEQRISEYLKEYFIFWVPRDIVSGDFYFFNFTGRQMILAVADCTGHGVPGGFMSMLGISAINEIVGRNLLQTSGNLLDELRSQIKISLGQNESGSVSKDGMDICLMIIDTETLIMQYSGANLPLFIFRNRQFHEIKPDKMPIGIHRLENPFTSNNFQLEKNDMIYMFSDGYIDQFGHLKDEKFKKNRFIDLLAQIHEFPVNEQKQKLHDNFSEWKGETQQIDDILIIGLKIT